MADRTRKREQQPLQLPQQNKRQKRQGELTSEKRKYRKCVECNDKLPIYGLKGGTAKDAKWCKQCKPADAVNIVSRKCVECNEKQPTYGPKGGTPKDAKWCKQCKPADAVDVKNKKCVECNDKLPIYGPKGGTAKDAKWCKQCKPADAVSLCMR